MDLKGKTILITGAAGGLGRAFSEEFEKQVAKLILIDVSKNGLVELLNSLSNKGHQYYVCDLAEDEEINNTLNDIKKEYKKIDILINLAGAGYYKKIEDLSIDEWDKAFDINVRAPFILTKELLPILNKSNEPLVVNIGSGMSKVPTAGRVDYCSSKSAMRGMSLALSQDFRYEKLRFMHIALGSTMTPFGPLTIDEKKELEKKGKKYFTPEWVAEKLVGIIRNNEIKDEITLYPSNYLKDSK